MPPSSQKDRLTHTFLTPPWLRTPDQRSRTQHCWSPRRSFLCSNRRLLIGRGNVLSLFCLNDAPLMKIQPRLQVTAARRAPHLMLIGTPLNPVVVPLEAAWFKHLFLFTIRDKRNGQSERPIETRMIDLFIYLMISKQIDCPFHDHFRLKMDLVGTIGHGEILDLSRGNVQMHTFKLSSHLKWNMLSKLRFSCLFVVINPLTPQTAPLFASQTFRNNAQQQKENGVS